MKKLLLASTSLAVLAYAGSAMAAEGDAVVQCWDNENNNCTFMTEGNIHGTYNAKPKYFVDTDVHNLNVSDDTTFIGQFTLDNVVKITADEGKILNIEGYLTETNPGSDISGVDVSITKHVFSPTKTEGELVLGNTLTIGNVDMNEGTGIFLYGGESYTTVEKTLTIADGKTLGFAGDNYVASNVSEQTLTIDGNGTILTQGAIALNSDVTLDGNTGISLNDDTTLTVADEKILTFAGNNYVESENSKTLTISGDGAVVNQGMLTLASNVEVSATGGFANSGNLDLQNKILTGDVTAYDGSTIKSLITDPLSAEGYGKIVGDLSLEDGAKSNIEVSVDNGVVIPEGGILLDLASSDIDGFVLKDGMYKITPEGVGALRVKNKSLAEKTETLKAVGGTGNDVNSFDAWSQADLTGASAAAQTLQQAIAQASGDAAQLVGILKEITPESPTVVAGAAVSGVTNTMGVIGANAFSAGSTTGKSSGDPKLKNAVWAQGLYNKAEFKKTGYGWDAKTWGLAAGADHKFDNGFKLGAGYSYTDADIKAEGTKTPAKTHTIFAYGEYKPAKDWYVNGILSYSFGEYKPKSGAVTGEYDVNTFGAQLMGGYSFDWFTPEAGIRYFHVAQDSYTDSIGQKIGKSTSNIWTAVIGAKASKEFKVDSMKLIPEARLAATYDLKQGEDTTTVGVFGTNYEVKGKNLSRFGFEVGAGLTADWGAFELTAKYEGKFRSDYTDNTGILEAKYNF